MSKPWFDNPRHPLWLLMRQVVVMFPLAILLACGYKNGWTASDWKTLLVPLATMGLFDVFKSAVANRTEKPDSDDPHEDT